MAKPMDQIGWKELEVGCVIVEPGNASEYLTGSWRSRRPVVNAEECSKCAQCWMYCPDAAVKQQDDETYAADLDYCKGLSLVSQRNAARWLLLQ